MTGRVLIVEDQDKIADVLRDYLVQSGYETHRLSRGDEVLAWVQANPVDLVLLDIMLPGQNGLDVCKALRRRQELAIIMVTACVEEVDRLLGLELGADDYICKPFSPREVVARVKALLRRVRRPMEVSRDLQLDLDGWSATLMGRDLALTAVEFQLLKLLLSRPGRIFSRDRLMDAMYRDERIVADRTVDSHVKKLRRKIAEIAPDRDFIQSVYGVGYKYEERTVPGPNAGHAQRIRRLPEGDDIV
ncbi:MAG: response regulator [Burkholderiales bacterium]|nr:response regulator [Burkholderiales bacterium]